MNWLILSVLSATGIFFCFGLFDKWRLDNKTAIAVNYSVASILGLIISPFPLKEVLSPWMLIAIFLGLAFVYLFEKMAIITQKGGMSLGTISSQMSLVIPVLLAPLLYQENIDLKRGLGVGLSLISIYLIVQNQRGEGAKDISGIWKQVIIVFIGTGICTSLLKVSRHYFLTSDLEIGFLSIVFGISALSSWQKAIKHGLPSQPKLSQSVAGGILLGIPNLGSLVFLIRALGEVDSTIAFPINNVGTVLLSAFLGLIFFKQRLSGISLLGIGLALVGVTLLST